ncbi:hypothetical protein Psal013_00060 [Piscirickettsia salmonis]|nr:hypothetical protein Psal008_00061 [Piscirickettsia salmonis]QGO18466.1 hypothetical protein Psal013_00060 [Piscirickettsia salmonis]
MTRVHTSYEKNVLKIPIFCGCITRFCCQCVSPGLILNRSFSFQDDWKIADYV